MTPPTIELPERALRALLRALDPADDPESQAAGEAYVALQEKLTRFFERRGARAPDELAFETLRRVALRLANGVELTTSLNAFVFGFAKNILREFWRVAQDEELPAIDPEAERETPVEREERQVLERCLARCARIVGEEEYEQLLRFHAYDGARRIAERKALALEQGKTVNAVRIQAHRLRKQMLECLEACFESEHAPRQSPAPASRPPRRERPE